MSKPKSSKSPASSFSLREHSLAWRLMESLWFCEAVGFLNLGLAVFVFLSLVTAHPGDRHWNQAGAAELHNACGVVGAVVADLALSWIGEGAVFLPLLFTFFGVSWCLRVSLWRRLLMVFPSLPLCMVISTLAALLFPVGLFKGYPVAGGVIGRELSGYLLHNLNPAGTYVAILTAGLISFIMLTGTSLAAAFGYMGRVAWSGVVEPLWDRWEAYEAYQADWEEEEQEENVPVPAVTSQLTLMNRLEERFGELAPAGEGEISWMTDDEVPPKVVLRSQLLEFPELEPHPEEAAPPQRPAWPRPAEPRPVTAAPVAVPEEKASEDYEEPEPEEMEEESVFEEAPPSEDEDYGDEGSEGEDSGEEMDDTHNPEPVVPHTEMPHPIEARERAEERGERGVVAGTAEGIDAFQRLLAQGEFLLPPVTLLDQAAPQTQQESEDFYLKQSSLLLSKLKEFKVDGRITQVIPGPVVTRYELEPAPGIKISKIANLAEDLALALRSQVPPRVSSIPRRSVIGIEVPNRYREAITLREVIATKDFRNSEDILKLALGKDTEGNPFITDLSAMPHLLIAGTTGSGKSVCINTIMMSLLMQARPTEVQLILVDPKMLELSIYNDIPHLREPVVVDPKKAASALNWAVETMERRYAKLAMEGVRNIGQFNDMLKERAARERWTRQELDEQRMPYLVIIIDELADLMCTCAAEVETALQRLAQMARASGIHLILATQRPSVDVLTGTIKNNFPCRIAFRVASKVDSRTVIDGMGAEKLLGKGDMLFIPPGTSKLIRLHGGYISEREINRVVDFLKEQQVPGLLRHQRTAAPSTVGIPEGALGDDVDASLTGDDDEFLEKAVELVISTGYASISTLQRRFRVGYARAARLVDIMERKGIIGPFAGSGKGREVLVDMRYLEELKRQKK